MMMTGQWPRYRPHFVITKSGCGRMRSSEHTVLPPGKRLDAGRGFGAHHQCQSGGCPSAGVRAPAVLLGAASQLALSDATQAAPLVAYPDDGDRAGRRSGIGGIPAEAVIFPSKRHQIHRPGGVGQRLPALCHPALCFTCSHGLVPSSVEEGRRLSFSPCAY